MVDQESLQNLLPEINAIDDFKIKKCDIPLEIYIYEAERLHTRASEDLPKLLAINMHEILLDKLHARTNALRRAQLNWIEQGNKKKNAKQEWKAAKPEFLKFRTELIQNLQFAFRNDNSLLQKLAEIKQGNSNPDLVMDLAKLAVLGKENTSALEAINFELSLLDHAAEEAERMAKLLANINGRMYFKDDNLIIRNKAYSLLKECVDEIRAYGQFAFRDQADIAKAYSSNYRREKQKEYKKNIKANASTPKVKISTS